MQPVTFHLPVLLISIIFTNKFVKIPIYLFNAIAIASANFLSHKQPNEHTLGCPAHHSTWKVSDCMEGMTRFLRDYVLEKRMS